MVIVILVDDSVTTREHLPGASALRWASSAQFADGETEVRRGAGPSPKSHTQKLELGFPVWSHPWTPCLRRRASAGAEPTGDSGEFGALFLASAWARTQSQGKAPEI